MDTVFMYEVFTARSDSAGISFVEIGQFIQKLCPFSYFVFARGVTANAPTRTLGRPGTKLHMIFVH